MNIIVLDTETTGLEKPFCYDIGYQVINAESKQVLLSVHRVVEQTWHNAQLFATAYYANKRPLYIQAMRKHETIMNKYGRIMQEMKRIIKKYNVESCYAYNSEFDDKVIDFNCNWYHCQNPLENIPIYDIWAYATNFITNTSDYKEFCEKNNLFNNSGNYKQSAEAVYSYITGSTDFCEEHIGIKDCEIEYVILEHCIGLGAEWNHEYKLSRILFRQHPTPFVLKVNNKIIYQGNYLKKYIRNDIYNFTEVGQ